MNVNRNRLKIDERKKYIDFIAMQASHGGCENECGRDIYDENKEKTVKKKLQQILFWRNFFFKYHFSHVVGNEVTGNKQSKAKQSKAWKIKQLKNERKKNAITEDEKVMNFFLLFFLSSTSILFYTPIYLL